MSINAVSGDNAAYFGQDSGASNDETKQTGVDGDLMRQRRDLGTQTAEDAKNMLLNPDNQAYKTKYEADIAKLHQLGQTMSEREQRVLAGHANGSEP